MDIKNNISSNAYERTKLSLINDSCPKRSDTLGLIKETSPLNETGKNEFSKSYEKTMNRKSFDFQKIILNEKFSINSSDPHNSQVILDLKSILFEKINDFEFISKIAKKFVDEHLNSSKTQHFFKDLITKKLMKISDKRRNENEQDK